MRWKDGSESSAAMRARVLEARTVQRRRGFCNAHMPCNVFREVCKPDDEGEKMLEMAMRQMGLSARAHHRILKVARTIADLDRSESAGAKHLAEAIQYRSLDPLLLELAQSG